MNNFQFIKNMYGWGFMTKEQLHVKVDNKLITEDEYNKILNNETTANEN